MQYPIEDENNRDWYFGESKNGIPTGHGTMTWKDGQIYTGKNRNRFQNPLSKVQVKHSTYFILLT
jgi:hypothetical protein